jgi:hypothetical protein
MRLAFKLAWAASFVVSALCAIDKRWDEATYYATTSVGLACWRLTEKDDRP